MQNEEIGFIGLGNMGHPMAKNLEKAGFPLTVYNRTSARTAGFAQTTHIAENVATLVSRSNIIFTMLTNDAAAKAVYEQILVQDIAGKLFIDMSTIAQDTSIHIAKALAVKQAALLDAPVAGSTAPATEGTLLFMLGGEESDVARAKPYLEKMGKTIKHLGPNGQGLAAKIAINYFLSIIYQGLAEMTLLSDSLGIAREDMLAIVNGSASGSGATKVKTPMLLQGDFAPAFALDLMLKDVRLAKALGADFPLGNAAVNTLEKASEAGHGANDVMDIITYLKEQTG